MKILTWNVYKNNKDINKAVAFLKKQQADVICLQEFPAEHIGLLRNLDGHIAICDEVHIPRDRKKNGVRLYSVIFSRFAIKEQVIIPHKKTYDETAKTKDRYHHFQADSFYIDIDTPQGMFRVFNTHFRCFTGPTHRLAQFKEVLTHTDSSRQNIICGDFNTFAKPLVNILVWKFFGYKMQEIIINENKNFAKLISEHNLKNCFYKQVTFWKFPIQLDYILVPLKVKVKSSRVFLRPHGSDHFPLMLEI